MPRPDTHLLKYIVNGCLTCGEPEDARHSFTALYWDEKGELDECWLCQPCIRLIIDQDEPALILRNLTTDDILVRVPDMREAYLLGNVCRTKDVPAGFVLKMEERP